MRAVAGSRRLCPRLVLAAALMFACRGEGEILDLSEGEPADGTCALVIVDAAAGVTVTRELTSDWDTGSCYQLTIRNTGAARTAWWVQVTVDAAVTDHWNHSATDLGDNLFEWRGIAESANIELDPQATTMAGACLSC